jgi:hypothetical protein
MIFLNNKYTKYYYQLVQKAKDRNLSKGDGVYLEEHHIVPRSLNGSNEPDNLVMFTAREHYVAHKLLTKMVTGKQKQKMHMALWCMITVSDCEKYNNISKSNLYEKIRSEYTTLVSGKNHFNYGLTRSNETKEKIRQKRYQQVFTKVQLDKAAKTISTLVWMNDGKRSYRIRPEFVEEKKLEGLVKGRLTNYIDDEFKNKFKKSTSEYWKKVKETGHKGHLIKV